ncbi:MAG: hypothetical protein JXR91_01255 [Deltaproteobacteria bacterium]|nr:hypothetical protein [Deltaproteobacteria bacterium]
MMTSIRILIFTKFFLIMVGGIIILTIIFDFASEQFLLKYGSDTKGVIATKVRRPGGGSIVVDKMHGTPALIETGSGTGYVVKFKENEKLFEAQINSQTTDNADSSVLYFKCCPFINCVKNECGKFEYFKYKYIIPLILIFCALLFTEYEIRKKSSTHDQY